MPVTPAAGRPAGSWLVLPTAGYALAAQWPLAATGRSVLLAVDVLVAVAFVATGVVVGADPEHRATGRALWCAGAVWPLNWVNEWQVGPLPLVAALVGPLGSVLVAWALLRYPVRWRRRGVDRAVAAVLATVQAGAVAVVVVSRPEWHGLGAGTPWLGVWPSWPVFRAATAAYDAGGALVALAAPVCLLVRFRGLRGLDRWAMQPVVAAAVLAAALTALLDVDASVGQAAPDGLCVVQTLALVGVPLAFLAAAVERWLALRELPALATALREACTGAEVQTVLRDALRDPALTVLLRADDHGLQSWLDVDGGPAVADPRGRHVVPLVSARGEPLGLVLGDALDRHRTLVDPVVRTAARTVETARLQALVRARTTETRAGADRLGAVLALEERRLHEDLRTGPLRHLDTARGLLDGQAGTALEPVRDLARQAATQLARLATGEPPAVLTDRGLAAALLDGAPVPAPVSLVVALPVARFPHHVEVAAYFAVAELVTNAVKHAGAAGIRVEGHVAAGALVVRVHDDGRGGADPDGSGLVGVRDRVRAVGGDLLVRSVAGLGTEARLALPLEAGRTARPDDVGARSVPG